MEMLVDKGQNDRWLRPHHVKRVGAGRYTLALEEPLGKHWPSEIVSYPLPREARGKRLGITCNGAPVPAQISGDAFWMLVKNLQPHEKRNYVVTTLARPAVKRTGERHTDALDELAFADTGCRFTRTAQACIFSNGILSLKLPKTQTFIVAHNRHQASIDGPLLAIRRGQGLWLGQGCLQSPFAVKSIATRLIEQGELWATAEVLYRFVGGYLYRVRFRLRPGEDACEVTEESTLPVRHWPAPRPYKEIGSLGSSHWKQPLAGIANPCLRPCATSNFVFDVRAGLRADRLITHSTGSWEIMDMPLGAPQLKTYTAMRASVPFIDGAWLGVYNCRQDELLGVVAVDIAHWKISDNVVHPIHRTPGASEEVVLADSKTNTHLRFPVENMTRRWLLAVVSRAASQGLGEQQKPKGRPVRLEQNVANPLWDLHTCRGELRLDKVKDWVVDWPDLGAAHPRVLCRRSDFPAIRQKIKTTPEFRRNHERYKPWRGADRYILTGAPVRLAEIEAQTHARQLVEGILRLGYAGPHYAIGFSRPLRRYLLACDVLWEAFTPAEKHEVRRVCALAGYILSDGDYWQYAYRPGETTYLPNFNSDVFTCAGLVGLFLHDHPCAKVWTQGCVERLDIDLKQHLRTDGGGEENVGAYLIATWTQLYLPVLWALRNCGVKDYSTDAKVLAGARFLTRIICPPEPRDQGLRLGPPIGHHPQVRKAFPFFSQLAAFIKKSDPTTASHLMAAWRAMGSPVSVAPDHFGVTANPLTRQYIFHDPRIPAVAQKLGSYNLPHVGAVLRSHGASDRESYLFLKAGRVHSHHDEDEGSFHYFGRGVPLALDSLRIQNGAKAEEHNAVTFGKYGQPSGVVECFRSTAVADYVRARIAPRGFACDAMYLDNTHRSGWTREIVFIKSARAGGVDYLILKDSVVGPEPCQWNLDVLSRQPTRLGAGRLWFPGHKALGMGLEVLFLEPTRPKIELVKGLVNPDLLSAAKRRKLPDYCCKYTETEHWLLHLPAAPGTTFVTVLFPRREREMAPVVDYLEREETICVRHAEGRDLVFLRPNPEIGTNLDGVVFRGRAGIYCERATKRVAQPLDAMRMQLTDYPDSVCRVL